MFSRFNFKQLYPHLIALAAIMVFAAIYFHPTIQGDSIQTSDGLGYIGQSQELRKFGEDTGEKTMWVNNMFGGMPAYQLRNLVEGNYIHRVNRMVNLPFISGPIGSFFMAGFCFYIMLISFRIRPILAVVGALMFSYATFNIILYAEGHSNKILAVFGLPLVIAGIVHAYRKSYLLGGSLFALGMSLSLVNNHVQMTYYFCLSAIIYGLVRLYYDWKEGELVSFFKASGILVLGLILALGSSAINLLPTNDYVSSTVRGNAILTSAEAEANGEAPQTGFAWDRAMSWSNGTKDLIASFVPMAAGGGSGTLVERDSPFGRLMSRYQVQTVGGKYRAPTYHGNLPFTVGPKYFGTVVLLLFFIGMFSLRGPLMWWMVGGSLLIILLSMGSEVSWLNRPLFDHLPQFNKFRAPDSAMVLSTLFLSTFGILGLSKWIGLQKTDTEQAKQIFYKAGGVTLGLALLALLFGPSLIEFSNSADAGMLNRMFGGNLDANMVNQFVGALEETRVELYNADALRTFVFAVLSVGLVFLFLRSKINDVLLIVLVGVLAVVDYHGINNRYHDLDEYQPRGRNLSYFDATPVDQQILQDPDPYYRVFNQTVSQPFSDSKTSYLHKSVGGYHAAKLRRYDDLISRHLQQGNQQVYNMLNTKYFIVNGAGGPQAQRNPNALGNAWFVNNIEYVATPNEEINALDRIDPATTAVVHRPEFETALSGLNNPSAEGSIQLTSYAPNRLTYTATNSGEGLAVFSDIWYGPDKGWIATVDGQEVDILRVNYVLRALRLGPGTHEIEMTFEPSIYAKGKAISMISSLLIILGLIAYGVIWFLGQQKDAEGLEVTPEQPKESTSQPLTRKTSTKPTKKGKKKKK